jgi:fructoselysine-6-P-deglycase FrlB-like protein
MSRELHDDAAAELRKRLNRRQDVANIGAGSSKNCATTAADCRTLARSLS